MSLVSVSLRRAFRAVPKGQSKALLAASLQRRGFGDAAGSYTYVHTNSSDSKWTRNSPDGWNRRPQLPVQSTPLTEDDEMTWPDACVDSEPALDDNVAPDVIDDKHQPLRHLLLAFGGFSALIFGIKSYLSTQSPVGNYAASSREYPFDNLRVEMGGRNGKP